MPIYLKYGDIKGDVKEPAHRGWIEVMSFQWGVARGVSTPTGGSADREGGTPSVSEITVTKTKDSTSVHLAREALGGGGASAIIDLVKQGSVYLRYVMSETMVSGYAFSGSHEGPTESLTLNFTKIELKYIPGTPPP